MCYVANLQCDQKCFDGSTQIFDWLHIKFWFHMRMAISLNREREIVIPCNIYIYITHLQQEQSIKKI